MTIRQHVSIATAFALTAAVSFYLLTFFGWLTAYHTHGEPLRQAQLRAHISFAVFVFALTGFVVNGSWWWWVSRPKVG